MIIDSYKQYLDKSFIVTSYKEDCRNIVKNIPDNADTTLYNDDFWDMRFSITELDTENEDLGEYVRLVETDRPAAVKRSQVFFSNYMRVFRDGFSNWQPVKIDITPASMHLYFFRFGGENGLCDGYEVLELKYPAHIKMEIMIESKGRRRTKYSVDARSRSGETAEILIEEQEDNGQRFRSRLSENDRGVYMEIMYSEAAGTQRPQKQTD